MLYHKYGMVSKIIERVFHKARAVVEMAPLQKKLSGRFFQYFATLSGEI